MPNKRGRYRWDFDDFVGAILLLLCPLIVGRVVYGIHSYPYVLPSVALDWLLVISGLGAGSAWVARAVARARHIRLWRRRTSRRLEALGPPFDFQVVAWPCFEGLGRGNVSVFRLALFGFVGLVGFVGIVLLGSLALDHYFAALHHYLAALDPYLEVAVVLSVPLIGGLVAGRACAWAAGVHRIHKQSKKGYAAYLAGDAEAVAAVHAHALTLLRDRVRKHRERLLGTDSEWGRARVPLAEALDEAEGQIAYWRERRQGEPDNELAPLQLGTARRLHAKLKDALAEVDARAAVLRQFYRRCEAKLAAMDRSNNDLVEVRRLEELSGKADTAIAHAQGTMEGLAKSFLAEAQSIASALGSADRSQLGVLAGDAPIENIEYLADKIHESRERDRDAIEKLERTLLE